MKPLNQELNSNSITYRNAIYEGSIDPLAQTRKDFGIIYMAKSHEFIVCNNWHNDYLQGECLFYNDDKKYVYGTWINNLPQGFNVFRFQETLVMAEFKRGKLCKNTKILIVFQKYNIGAILIVINEPQALDDLQLQIYTKKQVFSSEDVRELFDQCQWPEQYFTNNQTLIKYISAKLTKKLTNYQQKYNHTPCKLRLIQNKYYRFGYDDGLAIVFDEDFNRISVGSHCKSKLKSFGIVFDRPEPVIKPEKGKIIKIQPHNNLLKTAIKNQMEKPQNIQTVDKNKNKNFKTSLLIGVNFCNKFYKNPSKLFEFYIQNIINQTTVRNLVAGSLTTRKLFEESLQFSRIDTNRVNNLSTQQIFNQKENSRSLRQQFQPDLQQGQKSSSGLNKNKIIEDRLRLQAIKKEIYDSLEKKKTKIQKEIMNEEYQREIINKEIVGRSHYQTPQRTLDKSRSRKKIFQESQKNIKLLRDFTPSRSEPNLTPFKTKMKNRIFHLGQSRRISEQRQFHPNQTINRNQNNQKFHPEQSEQIQIQPAILKDFNKFSSDHSQKNKQSYGMIKNKGNKNRNNSQLKQQHLQSLNDYHVSFQDNRESAKRSNASSKKYPSQSTKNHQYVPINPSEVKQRKKLSQNFISVENQPQDTEIIRKAQEKSRPIQNKNKNNNDERNIKQEKEKFKLKQKLQFKLQADYYLQKSQSNQFINRMSGQRSSKKVEKQKQLNQRDYLRQINKSNNFYDDEQQDYNKERQHQNRKLNSNQSQSQKQKQATTKTIYNQDTFKQNTFSEEQQNSQNLSQSKRSAFKHSNQIYLDQQKYSQHKQNQTQNKRSTQTALQYTQSKNITLRDDPKQRTRQSGVSYMQKHKVKKSIEKEIEKSPDRHRCYGKSANSPYLQNSPSYSKDFSYHNTYRKGELQYDKSKVQYERSEMHYDDSSYKITRKQIYNPNRNYPTKLF